MYDPQVFFIVDMTPELTPAQQHRAEYNGLKHKRRPSRAERANVPAVVTQLLHADMITKIGRFLRVA